MHVEADCFFTQSYQTVLTDIINNLEKCVFKTACTIIVIPGTRVNLQSGGIFLFWRKEGLIVGYMGIGLAILLAHF